MIEPNGHTPEPNGHRPRFRFTKENARSFSAKGVQVQAAKRDKLKAEAELGRSIPRQAERIAEQLERIEGLIARARKAPTLQKLATAHDKLFRAWQVLTATPNPGARKVKASAPVQRTASEPRELLPTS